MSLKLNEKLKEERKNLGLNQVELAKIFNVSKQTVSNWESGKRIPETLTIEKLANLFGVTSDYLIGISEHRNNEKLERFESIPKEVVELAEEVFELNDENRLFIKNLINKLNSK